MGASGTSTLITSPANIPARARTLTYFSGAPTAAILAAGRDDIGVMFNPGMGNVLPASVRFAADNGRFSPNWNEDAWQRYIYSPAMSEATFVVVPDVFMDAEATNAWWQLYAADLRAHSVSWDLAYVLQNGAREGLIPWDELDVLFVGGDDVFKLGWAARHYVAEARQRGKKTHMGRVNSWRRILRAHYDGYDSVDGTFLKYGPDVNLPTLVSWLNKINRVENFA